MVMGDGSERSLLEELRKTSSRLDIFKEEVAAPELQVAPEAVASPASPTAWLRSMKRPELPVAVHFPRRERLIPSAHTAEQRAKRFAAAKLAFEARFNPPWRRQHNVFFISEGRCAMDPKLHQTNTPAPTERKHIEKALQMTRVSQPAFSFGGGAARGSQRSRGRGRRKAKGSSLGKDGSKTVDWTKDNPFATGSNNAFHAGGARRRQVSSAPAPSAGEWRRGRKSSKGKRKKKTRSRLGMGGTSKRSDARMWRFNMGKDLSGLPSIKQVSSGPGVGAHPGLATALRATSPKAPSRRFSKSRRFGKPQATSPGPGAYELPQMGQKKAELMSPVRSPSFSLGARKAEDIHFGVSYPRRWLEGDAAGPGPTRYDPEPGVSRLYYSPSFTFGASGTRMEDVQVEQKFRKVKISDRFLQKLRSKIVAASYSAIGSGNTHHKDGTTTTRKITGHNDFRGVFEAMDKDHSGSVSYDEFRSGLKKMTPLTDNEVYAVTQLLDQDGDGEIDIDEFLDFIQDAGDADGDGAKGKKAAIPEGRK